MLANRLRAARRDKRITLAGLGSMLGPPRGRTAVCEWEQGRCEPSLATVEQLAEVLNVSPCWLAFGVDHGLGCLEDSYFDNAKWSRRETPADPFEEKTQ